MPKSYVPNLATAIHPQPPPFLSLYCAERTRLKPFLPKASQQPGVAGGWAFWALESYLYLAGGVWVPNDAQVAIYMKETG